VNRHIDLSELRHVPRLAHELPHNECPHSRVSPLAVTVYRKVRTLPRHDGTSDRSKRRSLAITGLALTCAIALSGCSEAAKRGYLPKGVTAESGAITSLWTGSWTAALGVGVLVWGLVIWCVVAYRRKKDEVGLPEQLRYNVPIEMLYTVVPVFMVAVLFFYTARLESSEMDVSKKPDVTVNVVAKQWAWDFNYIEAGVYESGTLVNLTGKPGVAATLPALYLPVNKRVEFVLTSRDVIHSFWVPQFLMKLDVMPGKVNRFQITPTEIGIFQGKCAELCGSFHSNMLFRAKVVSQADFDAHMAELKANGNEGMLDNSLSREKIEKGDQQFLPKKGSS
jgi:cytochrome c oxidase subunit II